MCAVWLCSFLGDVAALVKAHYMAHAPESNAFCVMSLAKAAPTD